MFDKDKDGFLSTDELRKIMKERMSKKDLNTMIKEADSDNDGFINCKGSFIKFVQTSIVLYIFSEFCSLLCAEVTSKGRKKKSKDNANRIKEESERNDSSRSDSLKTLSKG